MPYNPGTSPNYTKPKNNWTCRNCGEHNNPDDDNCYSCGADTDGTLPQERLKVAIENVQPENILKSVVTALKKPLGRKS